MEATTLDKATFWASVATILGLAGAWLTFFATTRSAQQTQNDELVDLLDRLSAELQEISPWASGDEDSPGYVPESDQNRLAALHPDWKNPSRQLYQVGYPTIQNITLNPLFTRIRVLQEPLMMLNQALDNLYGLHREYRAYVLSRPEIYSATLRKMNASHPDELTDVEAEFLSHVFTYNTQLHQDLIGSRYSTRLCLYGAYRDAKMALAKFKTEPPLVSNPKWYWVLHCLVAVLSFKAILLVGAWLGFALW